MLYVAICRGIVIFYKFRAIVADTEFRCFIITEPRIWVHGANFLHTSHISDLDNRNDVLVFREGGTGRTQYRDLPFVYGNYLFVVTKF
jgi:hypothetical protein